MLYIHICTYIWASFVVQLVENLPAIQKSLVWFLGQEDLLEKGSATHSSILGGSDGKESACNVGDLGSVPGLGRSQGRKAHVHFPTRDEDWLPWGESRSTQIRSNSFCHLSVSKTLLDTEQALNKWFLNVKKERNCWKLLNNKIFKMSDFVASHTHTPPDPQRWEIKTCCRKAEGL